MPWHILSSQQYCIIGFIQNGLWQCCKSHRDRTSILCTLQVEWMDMESFEKSLGQSCFSRNVVVADNRDPRSWVCKLHGMVVLGKYESPLLNITCSSSWLFCLSQSFLTPVAHHKNKLYRVRPKLFKHFALIRVYRHELIKQQRENLKTRYGR